MSLFFSLQSSPLYFGKGRGRELTSSLEENELLFLSSNWRNFGGGGIRIPAIGLADGIQRILIFICGRSLVFQFVTRKLRREPLGYDYFLNASGDI